jgi:enoyl-CoA hydratase/carnithine racemase
MPMEKVRFEIAGDLGVITLANPPLNLFSEELIEDLREAVTRRRRLLRGP